MGVECWFWQVPALPPTLTQRSQDWESPCTSTHALINVAIVMQSQPQALSFFPPPLFKFIASHDPFSMTANMLLLESTGCSPFSGGGGRTPGMTGRAPSYSPRDTDSYPTLSAKHKRRETSPVSPPFLPYHSAQPTPHLPLHPQVPVWFEPICPPHSSAPVPVCHLYHPTASLKQEKDQGKEYPFPPTTVRSPGPSLALTEPLPGQVVSNKSPLGTYEAPSWLLCANEERVSCEGKQCCQHWQACPASGACGQDGTCTSVFLSLFL